MNPWVVASPRRSSPRLRLFCLPAAGSGASMYRTWAERLPEDVHVLPVQLPGRENRLAETPAEDYGVAVRALANGLEPLLDAPYVLFGHSMGALLAFGLARYRSARGLPEPGRLLVSGMTAPHRYRPSVEGALSKASDADLVRNLDIRGGTSDEALAHSELLEIVLPTLRADYKVCASMPTPEPGLLGCRISVFAGAEDEITSDGLHDWKRWSRAETRVRVFPGGHFFLTGSAESDVLAAVREDLLEFGDGDD